MNKKFFFCLVLSLILLASGCASSTSTTNQGPTISDVNIPSVVPTNTYHILSATTDSETDLEYKIDGGQKEADYGKEVEWLSPSKEKDAIIKIIADQNGEITTISRTIQVKKPPIIQDPVGKKIDTNPINNGDVDIVFNLKNISNNIITDLDLVLTAWNENGEPIIAGENYYYEPLSPNLPAEISPNKSVEVTIPQHDFEETPAQIQAYVSYVSFKSDKQDWYLK